MTAERLRGRRGGNESRGAACVCDSIGSDRSWSKGVRVCCGGTVCVWVGGWGT